MSDDALAALAKRYCDERAGAIWGREQDWLVRGSITTFVGWLTRSQGVVVLPPDHPLRTGEPSEAMIEAAKDAAYAEIAFGRSITAAVRAALAVLREGLDKTA